MNDKHSTPKQYFYGKRYKKEGNFLLRNTKIYAEFPPLLPPIVAKAYKGKRKPAGGFMVASDKNKDIVHPILRPDLNINDKKIYEDIAKELSLNHNLTDKESWMQFMNYNQICYLELETFPQVMLN